MLKGWEGEKNKYWRALNTKLERINCFQMIVILVSMLPPYLKESAHCSSLLPPQPDKVPNHTCPRTE